MMTGLCLGALLVGSLAALALPFLPFACAMMTAVLIGSASNVLSGGSATRTSLSALLLLVLGQVGYGFGLLAGAAFHQMIDRARQNGKASVSGQGLRAKTSPHRSERPLARGGRPG